ncbi:DUF6784 domain-containing protein [Candidatus Poribacteria bacterium]
MGVGFVFSAFLSAMRVRFIWWTFHPMGYIVASLQWAMRNFWSCMLIGSTAKRLILKYSGPTGYRKTVKVSVGLILGDFVIGGLWNVIGILFGIPTYSFWPGSYYLSVTAFFLDHLTRLIYNPDLDTALIE